MEADTPEGRLLIGKTKNKLYEECFFTPPNVPEIYEGVDLCDQEHIEFALLIYIDDIVKSNSKDTIIDATSNEGNSSNSSTDDDSEFDDEYNFPEDEFSGPGVSTAQNNNSIFDTQSNEMIINETSTNTNSISQSSNNTTYDINNIHNSSTNIQGLPVIKAGDTIRFKMVAYKNGVLDFDKLFEFEISSDELINDFAGHYLGETYVKKFEGTSNEAHYTILLINGVSEEDFRQQQALQANINREVNNASTNVSTNISASADVSTNISTNVNPNKHNKNDSLLMGNNDTSKNNNVAILLPTKRSELREDKHFYFDNNLQKDTWVYYIIYYYHLDENGDIEKNKWIDDRYVGEDGRMYRSRQTPDGLWVGDNGIVIDINSDLYNSTIKKEVAPDSWYCTNAGLWYYFENDRTTTRIRRNPRNWVFLVDNLTKLEQRIILVLQVIQKR